MTQKRRLDRLEQRLAPDEPLMTFTFAVPPEGLTREEHDEWARQQQAECEARGVLWFSLNLGECDIKP